VIPPNLGPPKHITFHDGAIEGKLRNQLVYQACISKQEMAQQKYMMGNRLVLKFKEEVIGEGQIILIAPVTYADITQYDAVLGGYFTVPDGHRKIVLLYRGKKDGMAALPGIAAEFPELSYTEVTYPQFQAALDVYLGIPATAEALGPLLGPYRQVNEAVSQAVEEMLAGSKDPVQALDDAAARSNEVIAEYNRRLGR